MALESLASPGPWCLSRGSVTVSIARRAVLLPPPLGELEPAERALLSSGATVKRAADFAAGRMAVRAAVRELCTRTGRSVPESLAILRETGAAAGRPRLVDAACRRELALCVSLSHADGLAVGAAAEVTIGIDLVTLEPLGRAFRDEAFAADECAAWARFLAEPAEADRVACAAFAAKEAALKWMGTGLRVPLHSVVTRPRAARATGCAFDLELHAPGHGEPRVLTAWIRELDGALLVLAAG